VFRQQLKQKDNQMTTQVEHPNPQMTVQSYFHHLIETYNFEKVHEDYYLSMKGKSKGCTIQYINDEMIMVNHKYMVIGKQDLFHTPLTIIQINRDGSTEQKFCSSRPHHLCFMVELMFK
jgi:hypothetical protein